MKPEDFTGLTNGCQGRGWSRPDKIGFTSLKVLTFLKGQPWDEMALCFVTALRPSSVRVVPGGIQLDSRLWRVTVWLRKGVIDYIEQEVEVGLMPEMHGSGDLHLVFANRLAAAKKIKKSK